MPEVQFLTLGSPFGPWREPVGDWPDGPVAVLVQGAEAGLAAAIQSVPGTDPVTWLQGWEDNARILLRRLQSSPSQTVALDAREVSGPQQELADWLAQRFQLDGAVLPDVLTRQNETPSDAQPLALALAVAAAALRPRLADLHSELLACCAPWKAVDPTESAAFLLSEVPLDVGAAAAQLARLTSALGSASRLESELQQEQERTKAQSDETERQLKERDQELDLMLTQLHSVQEELETVFLDMKQARHDLDQARNAHATSVKDLEQARSAAAQRQVQLEASQAKAHESAAAAEKLRKDLDAQAKAADKVRVALERSLVDAQKQAEESLEASAARSRAVEEEVDGLRQHLAHQTQLAQQLKAELAQARAQLQAEAAASQAMADAIPKLERSLQAQQRHALELSEQLVAISQAAEQAGTAYDARAAELQQQADELKAALAEQALAASQESESLQQQTAAQARLNEELTDALAQARSQIQAQSQASLSTSDSLRQLEVQLEQERTQANTNKAELSSQIASVEQQKQELAYAFQRLGEEHAALTQTHAALVDRSSRQSEQLDVLQRDLTQAVARANDLDRALERSRRDGRLLQEQLRLTHGDLARSVQEAGALRVEAQHLPGLELQGLRIDEVVVVAERDTPPYRELSLQLRQVGIADRVLESLDLRLVEHFGHPGLVIFASPAAEPPPLGAWHEDGQEGGRAYCLIVPSDRRCEPLLSALSCHEWMFIQWVTWRIQRVVSDSASLKPHWASVARRLRDDLQEMTPRLRWNSVQASALPGSDGAGLHLRLQGLSWAGRSLPALCAQWWPEGPRARLQLMVDADGAVPLLSWPVDGDGQPVEALALPSGAEVPENDRLMAWQMLPGSEHAFVLELLRSWPAIVARGAPTLDGLDLHELAHELLPRAQADLRQLEQLQQRRGAEATSRPTKRWLSRLRARARQAVTPEA